MTEMNLMLSQKDKPENGIDADIFFTDEGKVNISVNVSEDEDDEISNAFAEGVKAFVSAFINNIN